MKRILLGLVTIVGAVSAMYVGATGAFFSDTETSSGNTFAAGAIDLLVDNESYYNGNVCAFYEEEGPNDQPEGWYWQGDALFPVAGTPCTTSWELDNLTGHLFFNFTDIKPDDEGEDTISLHVDTNDAYMCMNIALTENDDNTSTEPELGDGDIAEDPQNDWDGELAQNIQMVWWADDGDNVLEDDENVLSNGVQTLFNLASTSGPFVVALADSATNVWTGVPGPVDGDTTYYVGKAWCFGTLTTNPVANNGGQNPSVDPGVLCDGTLLNNLTQTDSAMLDISFDAVQARNNSNFLCRTPEQCAFSDETPGSNLITNGGFESPLVNTPQNWNIFDSVAGGWTVEWRDAGTTVFGPQNRPEVAHLELHKGVLGAADEGLQYAELDSDWGGPADGGTGEPASIRIYQDIPTVIGAEYRIRYAFAPRPSTAAAENNLEVRWGGTVVDTEGPTAGPGGNLTPGSWTTLEIVVQATTTTTRVQFTDLGTSNSQGTFLDDVEVVQTSCALPLVQ